MTNTMTTLAVAGNSLTMSPLTMGLWLLCLGAFVAIMNGLVKLAARVRGKTQKPPNQQLEMQLQALESRVEKIEGAQSKVGDELHAMHVGLLETNRESASRLHDRINPLIENTASIKGSMEAFTTTFRSMTDLLTSHIQRKS